MITYMQSISLWVAVPLILFVYSLALGGSLFVRKRWQSASGNHGETATSGRTGIRSKRLQGRGKNWNISNQKTGIDSEDANLDVDDLNIK